MRRIIVAALVAALVFFVPPALTRSGAATTTSVATSAATATRAVTAVGAQQPGIAFEPQAKRDHDLDVIAAAGMTWVRADFYWSVIQAAGRSSFVWGPIDGFVKAATARHLNVLALIAYSPAWARGSNPSAPPNNPHDYAVFAHAAAQRYAPMGVHAWEVWNEPNLSRFWAPKADPAAYTALLKAAYPAIKSADPKATVVSAGLSPSLNNGRDMSPLTFLWNIYTHGGKGSFDAVGYHPYSYPYAPMFKADWNTFYRTPDFHTITALFGDGAKKVWGTEVGYPTGTSSQAVSEQRQAANLVAAINQWRAWTFTGPLIVFTVRDASGNRSMVDDNMGLLRVNGSAKPSLAAIRRALH